uniref:Alpha 2-HS glycoprotein n=1 Tax=Varanus komodoensis TaxID=61221 RepID=A0A8D2L7H9_VARKO
MRSLQALVLLGLTLGCVAHAVVLSQARLPDCDSDEAEQAATVALYHINHNAVHGYKHALNQIDNIRVLPRRPFGELILLELKLVETECHVVSPVPAENCTVRALQSHAVEADCDVRMLRVQDDYKVTAVKCHSSPDSVEDLAKICPDCPVLAPLSNPDIVATAEKALADFNAGNAPVFYKLLEISRGMFVVSPAAPPCPARHSACWCGPERAVQGRASNKQKRDRFQEDRRNPILEYLGQLYIQDSGSLCRLPNGMQCSESGLGVRCWPGENLGSPDSVLHSLRPKSTPHGVLIWPYRRH